MKIKLTLFVLLFPLFLFCQIADSLTLTYGEPFACVIYRVGAKNIYFAEQEGMPINKMSLEEVSSYEFNNDFFQTNKQNQLAHSQVIFLENFKAHEIYRGLEDWFFNNSNELFGGIYFADEQEMIIHGTVSTRDYLRLDWVSVFQGISIAIGEDSEIEDCSLYYDVVVRVKPGRFKIIATNFAVKRNHLRTKFNLTNLYEKCHTKSGERTSKYREIEKLKGFLKDQIASISTHCENIKSHDVFKEDIIKLMLEDDDW